MTYDLFVSHASEDKTTIVDNLVSQLQRIGVSVWYDTVILKPGDSLSSSIDRGLVDSRFAIVVLSKAFFSKRWPEHELRGLVTRELAGGKVIVPIWHEVSKDDVIKFSPTLADKVALSSSKLSPLELAMEITRTVRPDIYAEVARRLQWLKMVEAAPVERIPIASLRPGPVRHERLSRQILLRARLIFEALRGAENLGHDAFVESLRREPDPSREVESWELMAAAYLRSSATVSLDPHQKQAVFGVLLLCSLGMLEDKDLAKYRELGSTVLETILTAYHDIQNEVNYRPDRPDPAGE